MLRFRSVSSRRGRQQRGYGQELSSKGRNCLLLLLFYLVLGMEPGALCVRNMQSTTELHSQSLQFFQFKPKCCLSADV